MRVHLPLLCTVSLILTTVLAGCGTIGNLTSVKTPSSSGAAPAVSAVAEQVNGVAPNRKQEVQFSEAMDPSTINNQTFTVADSSGKAVTGAVSYNPDFNLATFLPNPALNVNSAYTATITTAVASAGGVHLASAYSYTFTTRMDTDTSPISINSVSPAANAACVSATALITVTFDEVPDASTVIPGNFIVTGPGGAIPVKLSTNVTTTQVVLTPTSSLPSGTVTVTVSNVGDLADVKMAAPFTWSFSTACNGGGGGNGATTQYQAPLFSESALDTGMSGQIIVDTTGNTTVQLTGAPANTTYTVQFCPAVDEASTYTTPPCFEVTTVSSDSGGKATATAKFPRPGDWAGDFYLDDSAGKAAFQTYIAPTLSNQTYFATLLPATSTNGGVVTTSSPQDPLGSGTVSYSNGSLKFTVNGASPSTSYTTNESETTFIDSSGTYDLTTFTTDAKGNGSSSTHIISGGGGDLFQVIPQNDAGFIGGFSVP